VVIKKYVQHIIYSAAILLAEACDHTVLHEHNVLFCFVVIHCNQHDYCDDNYNCTITIIIILTFDCPFDYH